MLYVPEVVVLCVATAEVDCDGNAELDQSHYMIMIYHDFDAVR